MMDLRNNLKAYGASPEEVILLDSERHELVNYLDLLAARKGATALGRAPALCPDAVIEVEGRPALYILDVRQLSNTEHSQRDELLTLRRSLACRGDAAPLAVLQPGQIVLFASDSMTTLPAPVIVPQQDPLAPMLIRDLLAGIDLPTELQQFSLHSQNGADSEAIYDLLFRLLNEVTDDLNATKPLKGRFDEILSLVGRALFTRFLIDRGIINKQTFPELFTATSRPEDCFTHAQGAARVCEWLEANFNGELLPLPDKDYRQYFTALETRDKRVFGALSKILYRTTGGGQLHLDWGFVDFAYVPVGLLSQIYERYAHKWFGDQAKDESVHYTPHHIANFVVRQAFEGITNIPRNEAKVCDPAAGAGVFLVLAFRQLVAETWSVTGQRPDKNEIRRILYEQIRGFDINEHALKLAALSLYLTALELDPNPFPPNALKFKKLKGLTLIPTRLTGEEYPKFPVLGSLGPAIGDEHKGVYDLLIGNPPWTSLDGREGNKINAYVEKDIRRIAAERNVAGRLDDVVSGYVNPDLVPDLPFIWKAMEWTKADGVIGLVLHGRLLFKRTGNGAKAREAIFKALRVTGLLNGAGLKSSEVWPGIDQPFCILFAKNRVPDERDVFYFLSPDRDAGLNTKSIIRVDYQSALPIEWKSLEQKPYLLKTMFLGTALDVELVERIRSLAKNEEGQEPYAVRFEDYWTEDKGLFATQGYRVAKKTSDASKLIALAGGKLTSSEQVGFLVDGDKLPAFNEKLLERTRKPENYKTPLVIIKKAPGNGDENVRACLALGERPIIFNESFLGYSASGHNDGEALVSHLFLIANSDLYLYYNLMTSSRFGVERRVTYVEDLKDFPIVCIEALAESLRAEGRELATSFASSKATLEEVNNWVCRVYRLSASDRQVIRDTLNVCMPFKDSWNTADRQPDQSEINAFSECLLKNLLPFFKITNECISVRQIEIKSDAWHFIEIATDQAEPAPPDSALEALAVEIANKSGASRIFVAHGKGRLVMGMLAKYRYWTATRARICATDILRDHSDSFPIGES